ncbi:MAG: universal stress protein [Acidobacteriota bacterium]|nr:MAG: universal stress protein [Acidobacteriota bacterium]
MLPVKRVLAPTDFSDVSVETVRNASELAGHFGAELMVAHVIPPIPTLPSDPHYNFEVPAYQDALRENAERQLADTISNQVAQGIRTRTLVSYGDPAREIVRLAEEEEVDLIVIATHGLTGWQHIVFGSVAEKVVRTARCAVLTVRGASHP